MSQWPGLQSRVAVTSSGLALSGSSIIVASLLLTLASRQRILMATSRQLSRAIIWIWSASLSRGSTSVWQKYSIGSPLSMKVQQRIALFLSSPEVRYRIIRIMQLEVSASQKILTTSSMVVILESSSFCSISQSMSSKTNPSKPAFSRKGLASFSFFRSFSLRVRFLRMYMLQKMEKVRARQKQLPSLRVLRYVAYSWQSFCTLMQKPQLLTNSSSRKGMDLGSLMRADQASTSCLIFSCCSWCIASCFSYSFLSSGYIQVELNQISIKLQKEYGRRVLDQTSTGGRKKYYQRGMIKKHPRWDSNPQPLDQKSNALPLSHSDQLTSSLPTLKNI